MNGKNPELGSKEPEKLRTSKKPMEGEEAIDKKNEDLKNLEREARRLIEIEQKYRESYDSFNVYFNKKGIYVNDDNGNLKFTDNEGKPVKLETDDPLEQLRIDEILELESELISDRREVFEGLVATMKEYYPYVDFGDAEWLENFIMTASLMSLPSGRIIFGFFPKNLKQAVIYGISGVAPDSKAYVDIYMTRKGEILVATPFILDDNGKYEKPFFYTEDQLNEFSRRGYKLNPYPSNLRERTESH